ncbi:hypothetical protein [Burkholderia ubonensis]|uniref:hypothetical protein n=1 Tax=Burkholderia ubonensis TaxID=101571 RepID=UPI002ABE3D06|nr:hypothetical protein [Burkholderia ubonensis]
MAVELDAELERLRSEVRVERGGRVEAEKAAAVLMERLDGMADRATRAEARAEAAERREAAKLDAGV